MSLSPPLPGSKPRKPPAPSRRGCPSRRGRPASSPPESPASAMRGWRLIMQPGFAGRCCMHEAAAGSTAGCMLGTDPSGNWFLWTSPGVGPMVQPLL